jgi:hypothetical protein
VDRAGFAPFEVTREEVRKNLTDGIFGDAEVLVTAVLVGDVVLSEVGQVSGNVAHDDGTPLDPATEQVTVALWREVAVVDPDRPNALAVEATAGVDDTGAFLFSEVPSGTVRLAAFSHPVAAGVVDATRVLQFGTAKVKVEPGVGTSLPEPLALIGAGEESEGVPRHVAVTVELIGAPAEDTDGTFVFERPGTAIRVGNPQSGSSSAIVELLAPIGIYDLSAEVDALAGLVRGVVIVPDTVTLGPIELPPVADVCLTAGNVRDCDGDGRPGLPLPDPDAADFDDTKALFAACADACIDAFGKALVDATCEAGGQSFDCDDDADDQADVTEPLACLLAQGGTDRDGDGACEAAVDLYTGCATNTAETCEAAPPVYTSLPARPEYL